MTFHHHPADIDLHWQMAPLRQYQLRFIQYRLTGEEPLKIGAHLLPIHRMQLEDGAVGKALRIIAGHLQGAAVGLQDGAIQRGDEDGVHAVFKQLAVAQGSPLEGGVQLGIADGNGRLPGDDLQQGQVLPGKGSGTGVDDG